MSKKNNKMENFGKFMTVVLIITIATIIDGFVFSKLWLWYIVPIFQMQPISIVEAIGILLLMKFTQVKTNKDIDTDKIWGELAKKTIGYLYKSGLVLLCGWIITLFI